MKKAILIILLSLPYFIFSQYSSDTYICVGGGTYGSLNQIEDIFLSTDLVHILSKNGLGLGSKYQLSTDLSSNINHRLFFTVNMLFIYPEFKGYSFLLPNYEIGIKIDDESDIDLLCGIYWIGLFITPSINYTVLKKELDLGVMFSIPIYGPR